MNNETYWKIRRLLPSEFDKYSHEVLTDWILRHREIIIGMILNIRKDCDELIKLFENVEE